MLEEATPSGTNVIIAGGRDFADPEMLDDCMWQLYGHADYGYQQASNYDITIVTGGARGADTLGHEWAKQCDFPTIVVPAEWDKHGKAAGPIRNQQMAELSNVLVAFWDGESKGTKNMIDVALRKGLEVHVYRYIQ